MTINEKEPISTQTPLTQPALDALSLLGCFDSDCYPPDSGMEVDVKFNGLPSIYLPNLISDIIFHAIALKRDAAYIIQPKQCGKVSDFEIDLATRACLEIGEQLKTLREAATLAPVSVRLTFSVIGTDKSYSHTLEDADWLGYALFDLCHQIKSSGNEAKEKRSETHELLIASGVSIGQFPRMGISYQSVPRFLPQPHESENSLLIAPARSIPFFQTIRKSPEAIIELMKRDESDLTHVPSADSEVLHRVAARLAPYVNSITDRMAITALLAIFHFERPALLSAPDELQTQLAFMRPTLDAIECVIDLACEHEAKGVKARDLANDNPIIIKSLASIAARDPSVFFQLSHDLRR